MGFSWSTVLVGDKATDGIFQELCDNLDTLYSNLELSAHSWVNIPTTGQNITATLVTEIRSVTDNADDQNKCRTHYADHDAAYQDGEKTTHWLNHNSNDQETHDSGIDITHDVGEDSA